MIPPMSKGTLRMALVAPPINFNFSSIIPPMTFDVGASTSTSWPKVMLRSLVGENSNHREIKASEMLVAPRISECFGLI